MVRMVARVFYAVKYLTTWEVRGFLVNRFGGRHAAGCNLASEIHKRTERALNEP